MSCQRSFQKSPRDRKDVSAALALDWARVSSQLGKGTFADAIGVQCTETVNNALTGKTVPELHTALNSLLADPTALFKTFQLFGGCFVATEAGGIDDTATISRLLGAAHEYFERMKDRKRCHNDTLALAELFIPLIPSMLAIIREADKLRGAA